MQNPRDCFQITHTKNREITRSNSRTTETLKRAQQNELLTDDCTDRTSSPQKPKATDAEANARGSAQIARAKVKRRPKNNTRKPLEQKKASSSLGKYQSNKREKKNRERKERTIQGNESGREDSISQTNKHTQMGDNCDLLHWNGNDEIVAEGKVILSDPNELFNGVPLGPNAMKILILCPRKPDAFLWRPSPSLVHIGDAKNDIVAWPANKVVMRIIENFENDNMSKTDSTEIKCKLYDWGGSKELVAEGRVHSSDPNQLFNGVPLGPNAMIVWVDNPKKEDAFLWRPVAGMSYVRDVVGKKIAWPEAELVCEMGNNTSFGDMTNDATPMSINYTVNTKCKLVDVHGTGIVVAEGTVSSTDPNTLVHCVPLGNNAIRVWVDAVKVGSAKLWRPSPFFDCILDAFGSTIAWPTSNIIMDPASGN